MAFSTKPPPAVLGRRCLSRPVATHQRPAAALFIDGDPGCLWQPQIAVIGSRNPTAGGLDHARDFAATLARQGMTITSGLASGIDTAAHTAALDAGALTIAVNGTGLDQVYPSSSQALPNVSAHRAR